ncbi:MAG: glycosyltransferase family 4 protein [bacterium]
MKIHILYNFQDGPTGGGNQFLKALKVFWQKQGIYEESPEKADVILFNSHHELNRVFRLKKKFPEKVFVHRIDGPIQLYRGKNKEIDNMIFKISTLIADGVIFQSNWSKEKNRQLCGRNFAKFEIVIYNASDPDIFNNQGRKEFNPSQKIRLVATSWSANLKKGFGTYQFLDNNLNFQKYKMTFVGNLPVTFKNIKWVKPVPSKEVAEILKQNDIYITASQEDACSNSLIEALSCGLPAIALNDGGHPELLQKGGELFEKKEDVIVKIEKVANNYSYYQNNLPDLSMQKISGQYFDFCLKIFEDVKNGYYFPRQVGVMAMLDFGKARFFVNIRRVLNKLKL